MTISIEIEYVFQLTVLSVILVMLLIGFGIYIDANKEVVKEYVANIVDEINEKDEQFTKIWHEIQTQVNVI